MTARSIIRVTSVALSLGLILAFAITAASADLPSCRNCVEASDIAAGAVGTSEIKNGAIRVGDMAASATSAAGTTLLNAFAATDSTIGEELDRFKVKAPGPGYLFVQVTGKYNFEISALTGETGVTKDAGTLALCTTTNTVAGTSCGSSTSSEDGIFYADADSEYGAHQFLYFSLSRVIRVTKAGTTTFYLNGKVANAAEPVNLRGPVRATAMFVPRLLSVTT